MPSAMVAPPFSSPAADPDPAIAEAKRRLRAEMHVRRKERADPSAGPKLAASIQSLGPFAPGAVVSGFYPIPPEIDVVPTLSAFAGAGHTIGLPVIVGRTLPLLFRSWTIGAPLARGAHGIPFPGTENPEVSPSILLVPLLAYDKRGHRLGYGGGYYDRTLADLRAKGPILAIGVAYAFQEIDEVPISPVDVPIDAIATDAGARLLT